MGRAPYVQKIAKSEQPGRLPECWLKGMKIFPAKGSSITNQDEVVPFLQRLSRISVGQDLADGGFRADFRQRDLPPGRRPLFPGSLTRGPDLKSLPFPGVHVSAQIDTNLSKGEHLPDGPAMFKDGAEGTNPVPTQCFGSVQAFLRLFDHDSGLLGNRLLQLPSRAVLGISAQAKAGRTGDPVLAQVVGVHLVSQFGSDFFGQLEAAAGRALGPEDGETVRPDAGRDSLFRT